MPHISELKESKFLKKEDCGPKGILVTIAGVRQENVAQEGAQPELKWCVVFREPIKPMVLNITNGQLIAQITGADDTDGWTNHRIVLFNDPTVSYAGKLTGGIRARAPRTPPAQPARPAPPPPRAAPPPPPPPPQYDPSAVDWESAQHYGYGENPDADEF